MNIDQKGLALIKEFEGFSLKAYPDTGKIPTIGWGTIKYEDGTPVRIGDIITQERAEELLVHDVKWAVKAINDYIMVPLNQNQFDALVSFTYNLGVGALRNSTLRRKLNTKDYDGAAKEFLKWIYDDGKIQPGLVKRRNRESFLFLSSN